MLIQQGPVRKLSGLPWTAIELVSEARVEEATLHISRWARRHLHDKPFQLLFPVKSRDLDGVQLLTPYLMARTTRLEDLMGLSKIYGVLGPVVDVSGRIIPIEEKFGWLITTEAQLAAEKWSGGIREGSFVRILFGNEHMLCGEVKKISHQTAWVLIRMRLRRVMVKIPVRALLNLGDVPEDQREYFYLPRNGQ